MSSGRSAIFLFLKKTMFFLTFFFLVTGLVVIGTKTLLLNQFNFKLGKNKTVLVLGDSHTQCALNDSILNQTINLSESADTFFYSYVKFKHLLKNNPQLKTVVIGYSYHNVSKNQDAWLTKESINAFKLPLHFFLFDSEDCMSFCKINGRQMPENTFKILIKNVSHLYRVYQKTPINQFGIGGYLPLQNELKENVVLDNKSVDNEVVTKSTIDLIYLKKIYDLATQNKIKVILLSAPVQKHIYQKNLHNYSFYKQFKNENLPNAELIDNTISTFSFDDFADSSHLNKKGSLRYCEQIKTKIQ